MPMNLIKLSAAICALFYSSLLFAEDAVTQVQSIIDAREPPDGIVFEIVSGDEDHLAEAIPEVQGYIEHLRARHPDLAIAVVTHGNEMFALARNNKADYENEHRKVQSLTADDVDVHVCGTYAEWNGLDAEAFPEYVDVAPSGPAQINSYIELGYMLIRL